MFTCKVCLEKDKRLADLLNQVAYLRDLANPAKLTVMIPEVQREQEQILAGGHDSQGIEFEKSLDQEAIESEANRILSGNY